MCFLKFPLLLPSLTIFSSIAIMAHDVYSHSTSEASLKATKSSATTSSIESSSSNRAKMANSFAPFKPNVRYYWDDTYFYVESDGMPDEVNMPNPMVGITSWQQQLPMPSAYFSSITRSGLSNVWRIPLSPTVSSNSTSLATNLMTGAVALAANGIPIFNPRNNRGEYAYSVGELDQYGGHCGKGDDYHYHMAPTHLSSVLGNAKPIAWALDGYPIYGYLEPDGSSLQALDSDGGHDHGGFGYHYHARGTSSNGTYTPVVPFLMSAMHGVITTSGTAPENQITPQPSLSAFTPSGSPISGASITAFSRPGPDQYQITYKLNSANYTASWTINRTAHTVTVTRSSTYPSGTISANNTTTSYTSAERMNYYEMAEASMSRIPDTGQTLNATATVGEDSDYTINAPSFTDNTDGTVTDNITGLMWQKMDSGEMTWNSAKAAASSLRTGNYTDWRLPTAQEALSILNFNLMPTLDSTYFTSSNGTAEYFWTSDLFYGDNTKVWATNTGGGLGSHSKTETISAGGSKRFHARYVRGADPSLGHNYCNHYDGTITDLDTGLMWTQVPSSTAMTWANALSYAENLTTGNFSDWRLPNIKELQSLVDIPRATATSNTTTPCLNTTLFSTANATSYWSSTSVKNASPTQAWLVDFGVNTTSSPTRNQQGIVSYGNYTTTNRAFAVRGPITTTPTLSLSGSNATISWPSLLGIRYWLQHTDDLNTDWLSENVGEASSWTDGNATSNTTKRFYRISY